MNRKTQSYTVHNYGKLIATNKALPEVDFPTRSSIRYHFHFDNNHNQTREHALHVLFPEAMSRYVEDTVCKI